MKKIKTALLFVLILALLLTGILTFALPDTGFSANENRVLTQKPTLTLSTLLDGSFGDALSDYLSDQIPLRNTMIRVETKIKLLLGQRDISGAYIGKDSYFFEKVTDADIDLSRYQRNLSFLEQMAESHAALPFTVMLVPSSGVILQDKLPTQAQIYDADRLYTIAGEALGSCTLINPSALLQAHADEDIYYRTDHHWTTRGAYLGYLALAGRTDASSIPSLEVVSTDFCGTLHSKVSGADVVPDVIEILPSVADVSVSINNEPASLYDMNALSEKDQYQIFFGGNASRIDITGGHGEGSLLIIKDSFANCMVPFLLEDYAQITMIDLRYTSESVGTLLAEGSYDEVLVLYELNNFATDANIGKILL